MKNLEKLRNSIMLLYPDEWLKDKIYNTNSESELNRVLKHLQKLKGMNDKVRHDHIENMVMSYYKQKGKGYIKLKYSLDNYKEWEKQFKGDK